jgi:hypothetical protein
MFEALLESARRACDGERTLADVRSLARFHRIQSSPGYDAAVDWMEEAILRAGLSPERIRVAADGRTRHLGFPMPEGWRCRHALATLHGAAARSRSPTSRARRSRSSSGAIARTAVSRSWRSMRWKRSRPPTCAAGWC